MNVMWDAGVTEAEQEAVRRGIRGVLRAAGDPGIAVRHFGVWRSPDWRRRGGLVPWQSVDWYIDTVQRRSRPGQLHVGRLLGLLRDEPWQASEPHYDVLVTSHDLYDENCRFCIGMAYHGFGTVISVARFRELSPRFAAECVVTETMHEVGHVFGLVPETRRRHVERSLGLHCTRRCIMRQGLCVPDDWEIITMDRIEGCGFCVACLADLRRYFSA